MRFFVLLLGLLSLPLLAGPHTALAESPIDCSAPRELVEDEPLLPALSERFKQHQPVTIVVIGGGSTAGTAPDNAYPHFLEVALQHRHPETPVTVLNRGVEGETTEQMVGRFAKDVYAQQPALVIWEAGTIDAVQGDDVNAFVETLTDGIAALRDHNSEIMLMDMQYNPRTVSVINFEPYLDALHQTATLQDVYMFQRFEIMKYWNEASIFDFSSVPREKRAALAREFYACLGERLAEAIDFAAR